VEEHQFFIQSDLWKKSHRLCESVSNMGQDYMNCRHVQTALWQRLFSDFYSGLIREWLFVSEKKTDKN